jgi:hypothetical protein
MTFSRNLPISIRFRLELLDIIDQLCESEFDGSRTACVVALCNDGLKLRKFQKMVIDNPEKQAEIIAEMNEKVENESVLEWLASKTDRQKSAYRDFLDEDLQ